MQEVFELLVQTSDLTFSDYVFPLTIFSPVIIVSMVITRKKLQKR